MGLRKKLKLFWELSRERRRRRDLLITYSALRFRVRPESYRHRREISLSMKRTECFVCGGAGEHRHHIVQLQFGGLNIRQNVVWLCAFHHADVHPWMALPGESSTSFWTKAN